MTENKRKDVLIIISLFLISYLIRIAGSSNINMFVDEWLYWIKTNKILISNFSPRADVFDYSPPFIPYIGAVVTLIFGGDLNNLRIISVIFGSLTVPFMYLLGKAMYNRKVGLLAALFMSFTAYHILYSRVYMLDAPTLFFITAFLYFFWLSQNTDSKKSITVYSIIAGAMLGLAFDVKYIAFFLIPAIIVYVLWIQRFNLKILMEKRIILTFLFAFLFFFPTIVALFYTGIGIHGFIDYAFTRFEIKGSVGNMRSLDYSPLDLLNKGLDKNTNVLFTWGAENLSYYWYFFKFSAILLLLIVFFYYLSGFLRRDKRCSFLIISLFFSYIVVLAAGILQHYLIYTQPFYFIMFSHVIINSFEYLKKENNYKNILNIIIVFLAIIIVLSSFITGIASSNWDNGDYHPWDKSTIDFIKKDISKSEYKTPVLVGVVSYWTSFIDYLTENSDIYTTVVLKLNSRNSIIELDLDKINMLKPDYLIVSDTFYQTNFKNNIKPDIYQDYMEVFHSSGIFSDAFVLKRKNIQPRETIAILNGTGGEISEDIFKKSVQSVMHLGNVYTVLVQVKNTGNSTTNFTIKLYSDEFAVYVDEESQSINLNKGSNHLFKFKLVPFRKEIGKFPITADLYAKQSDDFVFKKIYTVSEDVRLI